MITRRRLLQGTLGTAAAALLVPAGPLAAAAPTRLHARAMVLLYMHGGASQFETFDPKPGTASAGPTRAIATAVPGVQFAEHLPGLAQRAGQLALVRSLVMREGSHDRARYLMRTGHAPQGGVRHPGFGALVSARYGHDDFVGAVAIGAPAQPPGLLGARHAALMIRDAAAPARNLARPAELGEARAATRAALLDGMQQHFAHGRARAPIDAHSDTLARVHALARSSKLPAFELQRESAGNRARYGEGAFGAGCLLARRLIDADVAFVEVGLDGWDTHEDNFTRTTALARQLDAGMSALLDDLRASGRLDDTLVVCMGDFGRSPEINGRDGRDHFPQCNTVVLAGAGIPGGTVVGATSALGREVAERPVTPADLYRTLCMRLDIDADEVRLAPSGRPITTVDGGVPIDELA